MEIDGQSEAFVGVPPAADLQEGRTFMFIKALQSTIRRLRPLMTGKRSFVWDHKCHITFERLKVMLTTPSILGYPDTEGKFILDTDTINTGIGSILSQIQARVMGYFRLSKPERNYCVTRQNSY